MTKELPPSLKVGTGWIELEIISEANIVLTTFGYAPFLLVREITTDIDYRFYISAKSLAIPLEKLRKDNNDLFKGIQFRVRKESAESKAPYEIDTGSSIPKRPKLNSSEDLKKKLEDALLN